jgi:hypothetical protein
MSATPNNPIPLDHLLAITAAASLFGRIRSIAPASHLLDQPLATFDPHQFQADPWLDRTWKRVPSKSPLVLPSTSQPSPHPPENPS